MNTSIHAETPPPSKSVEQRKPVRSRWPWILLLLVVVGVVAYFLFYPKKEKKSPTERAIPVVIAVAQQGDFKIYLTGLGTVTALNTVTVHTRVDGQLDKVHFQEGQMVKAGDLLAEIDPRPFQVQLAQAQGQYAKDLATLKNAQLDLKRNQNALEAVSKQQVDTAAATVDQLKGTLESDKGQIDNANLQLTYCRIVSPLSGRVGLRLVDEGNIIHVADPNGLVVITQLQPITVLFNLPEDNLPQILKARTAMPQLPIEAYDRNMKNILAKGSLLALDNQIDSATGTVRLKAIFPNNETALYPNQFVNVKILVDVRHGALLVPNAAIQRSPQGFFVYVVKSDSTVEMRTVETGPADENQTLIEKGISPNEIVVTEGVDKLQNGSKVTIPRREKKPPVMKKSANSPQPQKP